MLFLLTFNIKSSRIKYVAYACVGPYPYVQYAWRHTYWYWIMGCSIRSTSWLLCDTLAGV